MAILKFRIYWEDDDSIYRDVLIRHTQTFLDLHLAILKCFEFDKKHQATFFKSNDNWKRGREISLEKYDKEYKVEPLLMDVSVIGSEIQNPNQKFIYVYDFHKLWTFLVELININKSESPKIIYPFCGRSEGIAPSQYGTKGLIKEKENEVGEEYDLNSSALSEGYGVEGEEEESDEADDDNNDTQEL
jgi:hypothetical protein